MIYSGKATVLVPGTPVRCAPVTHDFRAAWVTFHADANNAGFVYVGGVDEVHNVAVRNSAGGPRTYIGHPLAPDDWVSFRELGGPPYTDLFYIFVDSDQPNNFVTFDYGRR